MSSHIPDLPVLRLIRALHLVTVSNNSGGSMVADYEDHEILAALRIIRRSHYLHVQMLADIAAVMDGDLGGVRHGV